MDFPGCELRYIHVQLNTLNSTVKPLTHLEFSFESDFHKKELRCGTCLNFYLKLYFDKLYKVLFLVFFHRRKLMSCDWPVRNTWSLYGKWNWF